MPGASVISIVEMFVFAPIRRNTLRYCALRSLNATTEEIKTFEAGFESMQKGWTGILDQLTEYLAKV